MKLLLDTHIFLWMLHEPGRLSKKASLHCEDKTNELFLSVASTWEIQIKTQLGKLEISQPLRSLVEEQKQVNSLRILPISLEHTLALENLPLHHKDPFDRLLIAQTVMEEMTLVSADEKFSLYGVSICW